MIILRKSELRLVEPEHAALHCIPDPFDWKQHADSAQQLANVLWDFMAEAGGVGLSANQLGLNMRVFVMGTPERRMAVFNPEIQQELGEPLSFREGCLSYPGLQLYVKRPSALHATWWDEQHVWHEEMLTGITARIFLHEYDHMQGRDFTSRVSRLKLERAQRSYQKARRQLVRKHALSTMQRALQDTQHEQPLGKRPS